MNQLFFYFIGSIFAISIIIGELWLHQKALILFPRYYRLVIAARKEGENYIFNDNEKLVLAKFGRRLITIALSILWSGLFIITITGNITLNFGVIGLIIIFFLLFYNYHASFKD